MENDDLLTLEEIAERTRLPLNTHRYYRHTGQGPKTFKIGNRVVAFRSDVDSWIEQQYKADAQKSA